MSKDTVAATLAGFTFQKVVVPKGARDTDPIVFSITGKNSTGKNGGWTLARITISARLAAAAGMEIGQEWALYVDPTKRAAMIVREDSPSSRKVNRQPGSRFKIEYPYKPLSKLLPDRVAAAAAPLIVSGDGRIAFKLPDRP